MSSFFNSLVNKAQSSFEGSQLADQVNHLQTKLQGSGSGPGKEGSGQGGTIGNLGHQFKAFQMQYS